MKTQDIQIIHQEDFYDDYEENVMSDYQRNIEDILYEVITLSEEIPESYQYISLKQNVVLTTSPNALLSPVMKLK